MECVEWDEVMDGQGLIMEDLVAMAGSLMVRYYNRKLWQGFEQGNDII